VPSSVANNKFWPSHATSVVCYPDDRALPA